MDLKINRLFEMDDDLNNPVVGRPVIKHRYTEIYPSKIVEEGIADEAYIIRAKTFYEIQLPHIPMGMVVVLYDEISRCGLVYHYNPETYALFVYNASSSNIFILKDAVIGEAIHG